MADLFISYSRRDLAFVEKLSEALKALDREAWVDLEGIYAGEEFWPRICSEIEAADAFVFVISPDSTASEYCKREIDHAVKHNKRIMPVILRDANEKAIHEALAKLNWIFLRKDDDFDSGLQILTKALDTDLDWVHAHTRLLVRAREWENKSHNKSFVLRGSDLRDAEDWLVRSPAKEPKPTSLHNQYIIASRKAATRRQRITLSAVTFGLIVAIVLAVVALHQRQIARKRQREAERQQQIALARQLVAQAEVTRNQQPNLLERSVLLAVEAVGRFQELGLPSLEANQALRRGLALLPRHVVSLKHKTTVNTFTFSPDGRYLATCMVDPQHAGYPVIVWNAIDGTEVTRMETRSRVTDLVFSPDGKYLATASSDNTARVWEATSGKEITRMNHEGSVYSVAFSPDGKYLATASSNNTAWVWKATTGEQIAHMSHEGPVRSVAFSPDGKLLATASADKTTRIWELPNGQELGRIAYAPRSSAFTHFAPPTPRAGLTFSPDGKYLVTAGTDGIVHIWEVSSGRELNPLKHENSVSAVAFSPDNKYLATASADHTARVWEVANSREYIRMEHDGAVNAVAFSPDGRCLATASGDGTARVWEKGRGTELARMCHGGDHIVDWQQQRRFDVELVSFSPDGKYMATASSIDINVWQVPNRLKCAARIFNVGPFALSPNGRHLVGTLGRSWALVSEIPSGRKIKKVPHDSDVSKLSFSADGDYVASTDGRIVKVWKATGDGVPTELSHGSIVKEIVFSPDGKHLATVTSPYIDGSSWKLSFTHIWDWTEGQEVRQMSAKGLIKSMAFSENGDYLAAISRETLDRGVVKRTAWLWDTAKGQNIENVPCGSGITSVIFTPEEGLRAIAGLANVPIKIVDDEVVVRFPQPTLTPDGRYMAVRSGNFALVKKVVSGQEIVSIPHEPDLVSVIFSPDGKYLVTDSCSFTSDNRYVRFWLWRSQDLIEDACSRLSRNLTHQEWQRYLPDEPYRKTSISVPALLRQAGI